MPQKALRNVGLVPFSSLSLWPPPLVLGPSVKSIPASPASLLVEHNKQTPILGPLL